MTAAIASLDLTALAAAIASGEVSSEAATTAALDRLETVGRKLKGAIADALRFMHTPA